MKNLNFSGIPQACLPPLELMQESICPSKLAARSDLHFVCTRDLPPRPEKRFPLLRAQFHVHPPATPPEGRCQDLKGGKACLELALGLEASSEPFPCLGCFHCNSSPDSVSLGQPLTTFPLKSHCQPSLSTYYLPGPAASQQFSTWATHWEPPGELST